MPDSIKTPIGEMWLDEDGLLWHRVDALVVTPEAAAEVRRAVDELAQGRALPAVVDIRLVAYAEGAVRDAFAASAEESHELATALLVESTASEAMAQVFIRGSKPKRPVRLFTDEAEAVAWVKSFLPEAGADPA